MFDPACARRPGAGFGKREYRCSIATHADAVAPEEGAQTIQPALATDSAAIARGWSDSASASRPGWRAGACRNWKDLQMVVGSASAFAPPPGQRREWRILAARR